MIIAGSWTISWTGWNCKNKQNNNELKTRNLWNISVSSDLQWVKEVEDHLQKRTEDHSEEEDNNQDADVAVGIILLSSSADGLHQKLMSVNNVDTWV